MPKKSTYTKETILKAWGEFADALTDEDKKELLDACVIKVFKKDEPFYQVGDIARYFFFMVHGCARIYRGGVTERHQIIRLLKAGDCFSYRAAFSNQNYVTGAAPFTECTLCMIPVDAMMRVMHRNVNACMFYVKQLSKDLSLPVTMLINLTQKHVRGRLADALLALANYYGYEDDGNTIAICVTREDIACLANMTTANAIRTLSTFMNEGLIEIDKRRIKLLDKKKLELASKYE